MNQLTIRRVMWGHVSVPIHSQYIQHLDFAGPGIEFMSAPIFHRIIMSGARTAYVWREDQKWIIPPLGNNVTPDHVAFG